MRVTKHIEQLLRQGRKPKDLMELGFPKSRVTMVARRLRAERTSRQAKAAMGGTQPKTGPQQTTGCGRATPMQQKPVHQGSYTAAAEGLATALPEVVALLATAQAVGVHNREHCPHYEHGICLLRTWTSRDEIPKGIGEPVLAEEGERPLWQVKPSLFYCALCTALIEFLDESTDGLEADLIDDPLSGARSLFTCHGCGSKGWIATTIKCTRCGRQTWRGWFPEHTP